MTKMKLTFKKLRDNAIVPTAATKLSAGLDLHACVDEPTVIPVGGIVNFPTGIAVSPEDENVVMLVFVRSGIGRKFGLTLPNSVGVIDSDYRGEISVPIINHGAEPYTMMPGERFAQLVTVPAIFPKVEVSDELPDSERGTQGFGSTGRL